MMAVFRLACPSLSVANLRIKWGQPTKLAETSWSGLRQRCPLWPMSVLRPNYSCWSFPPNLPRCLFTFVRRGAMRQHETSVRCEHTSKARWHCLPFHSVSCQSISLARGLHHPILFDRKWVPRWRLSSDWHTFRNDWNIHPPKLQTICLCLSSANPPAELLSLSWCLHPIFAVDPSATRSLLVQYFLTSYTQKHCSSVILPCSWHFLHPVIFSTMKEITWLI